MIRPRGDRHLKAEQSTIFDAVARGFRFFSGRKKKRKTKGRGGPLRVALRHSHARHTAPYHPQPTGGLCQGPCGSGGHCRGRGLPQGHHNGPEEATAGPRHTSSALPRPRPVGHQSAPWPHQTPTKHPREVPTCLLGLGRPLGHCRGAGGGKHCAVSLFLPWSSGWVCRGSSIHPNSKCSVGGSSRPLDAEPA